MDVGGGEDHSGGGHTNGSYYCKERRKCNDFSCMRQISFVVTYYYNRRFAINERKVHLPPSMKTKLVWFV